MFKAQELFQTYKDRLIAWANEHSLFIEKQETYIIIYKTEKDLLGLGKNPLELEKTERLIVCCASGLFMAQYITRLRIATLKYRDGAYTYSENFVGSDGTWEYAPLVPVSEEDFERNFSIMQEFFLCP